LDKGIDRYIGVGRQEKVRTGVRDPWPHEVTSDTREGIHVVGASQSSGWLVTFCQSGEDKEVTARYLSAEFGQTDTKVQWTPTHRVAHSGFTECCAFEKFM
jgi:hypothetical protein